MRFAPFFPTRHGAQKGAGAQLRIDHTTTATAGRPVAPRFNPRLVPFPDPFFAAPLFLTFHRAKNGHVACGRFRLGTAALAWRPVAARLEFGRALQAPIV